MVLPEYIICDPLAWAFGTWRLRYTHCWPLARHYSNADIPERDVFDHRESPPPNMGRFQANKRSRRGQRNAPKFGAES